jgi:hypothetical protein
LGGYFAQELGSSGSQQEAQLKQQELGQIRRDAAGQSSTAPWAGGSINVLGGYGGGGSGGWQDTAPSYAPGQLGSGSYGIEPDAPVIPGVSLMAQPDQGGGLFGSEVSRSAVRAGDYKGSLERIARARLGAGATQREVNNYVGQLFEINNISDARRVQPDQQIELPNANTAVASTGLQLYGKDIALGERMRSDAAARANQPYYGNEGRNSPVYVGSSDIAQQIPTGNMYAPPAEARTTGFIGSALDALDSFNNSGLGKALQALPPEGLAINGIKLGLIGMAGMSKVDDVARLGAPLSKAEIGLSETARIAQRVAELEKEGHAVVRHGGDVTNVQLLNRAFTGVAPDLSTVVKGGQVVIPPSSTAFNSNELLVRADQVIREQYLNRALSIKGGNPSEIVVQGVDIGQVVGRGYDRVSSAVGGVGPLQYHDNLTRATAVLRYNTATSQWNTITIYPVK